jgi:hypothetical protein
MHRVSGHFFASSDPHTDMRRGELRQLVLTTHFFSNVLTANRGALSRGRESPEPQWCGWWAGELGQRGRHTSSGSPGPAPGSFSRVTGACACTKQPNGLGVSVRRCPYAGRHVGTESRCPHQKPSRIAAGRNQRGRDSPETGGPVRRAIPVRADAATEIAAPGRSRSAVGDRPS